MGIRDIRVGWEQSGETLEASRPTLHGAPPPTLFMIQ